MSQFQRWAAPTCLIFHKIYMIYEIIHTTGGLLSMNRMSPWAVGANSRLHDCFTPIFNLVLKENGAVSALKRWAAPTLWIFHRTDLIYIISNFLPPKKGWIRRLPGWIQEPALSFGAHQPPRPRRLHPPPADPRQHHRLQVGPGIDRFPSDSTQISALFWSIFNRAANRFQITETGNSFSFAFKLPWKPSRFHAGNTSNFGVRIRKWMWILGQFPLFSVFLHPSHSQFNSNISGAVKTKSNGVACGVRHCDTIYYH